MVRAYVLIETAEDNVEAVRDAVGHNLMNALAIGHLLVPGQPEVMVHIECDDLDALYQAMTRSWVTLPGVRRITPFTVIVD